MKNIEDTVLLLVDDEPNILSSLRRLFMRLGYQLLTAENGQIALELINSNHVDLVLSDYLMPVMNGGELLKRIHADHPLIALIMLTGTTMILDDSVNLKKEHIFKVVSKPWDNDELVETVQNALKKAQEKLIK
jgi:DNA-binding NtrC family response regulator